MSSAADRLSRLLALVPWLLAHPGTAMADVARTFGVSERQLADDLNLIFVCGLPGHTPGDLIEVNFTGDRVSLSNADTIARPLRLTAEEALALIVGLRSLAEAGDGADADDAVLRALAKIEDAAGEAGRESAHVEVSVEARHAVRTVIDEALEQRRRLHLRYHVPSRDEATERDVDPIRLVVAEGRQYLEGWCRLVDAVRLFRLDRVLDVQLLDVSAEIPPEARPRDLTEGLFQPSPDDEQVVLELTPAARWVADYYPVDESNELPDGELLVRLRSSDRGWIRRLVMSLGTAVRIVEPAGLVEQVRAEANAALEPYLVRKG
jgi:proteasome accessory factor C